jgi:phosphatidate phosphatase LPIN
MKIGEAGEAFFVFETDDEVPADLITSPLLQPTRPDEAGPTDLVDNLEAQQGPDGIEGSSLQNQISSPSSSKPLSLLLPTQEYSWEWGAFPQPSPMQTTFGKGGRPWVKWKGMASMDISGLSSVEISEETQERESELEHGRSHSVPPELDGSPSKKRKHRELPEDHEVFDGQVGYFDGGPYDVGDVDEALLAFGKGGRLKPSPSDPTLFIFSIDGRDMVFELSQLPHIEGLANLDGSISDTESAEPAEVRGRRNRHGGPGGTRRFGKLGDVEVSRLFSLGKVDFYRFLDDDDLVDDPKLVLRWAGDR